MYIDLVHEELIINVFLYL